MKLTLAFLAIAVCVVNSLDNYPEFPNTSWREECPKGIDCEAYAKEKAKALGPCSYYKQIDNIFIAYMICGIAICEENSREVRNMSKPFPDCCPDCEVIDPDKPAKFYVSQ